MSAKNLTRGPLPPGIYWRRRMIVLVGAAVLVFAIAHVLGGSSNGGSDGRPVAEQAGAPISVTTTTTSAAVEPTSTTGTTPSGTTTTAPLEPTSSTPLVLAAPTGTCNPADITVTPQVRTAVAGTDVTIGFALQTTKAAACTWQLSSRHLAVQLERRGRVLWSSQQCPAVVPNRSVVIRNVVPSLVSMVWNGRISTDGCHAGTTWVRPGRLTVMASTLGGEPGTLTTHLVLPTAPTATVTTTPTPTSSPKTLATPTSTGTAEPKR